jgi:hypothetical protein
MKYAVEMGSGIMLYIPSFIKIGSGIRKLMGGGTQTQTAWRSHKPTYIFVCFKIRKVCQKDMTAELHIFI